MHIDRCVCEGVTFKVLKEVADRSGCRTLQDLRDEARFATGCGLCRPYVAEMLRTGRTSFSEIIVEKAAEE
ncbi:MAG: (2Fe-2S)-binding protein [Rhodothermales bacterium]|nr:(2Fe-2S)-binding protein [Rhodothermales bacterium]MBO6778891.1 (2Fe-2S)-binding protein [Rhodothermales bacterium]